MASNGGAGVNNNGNNASANSGGNGSITITWADPVTYSLTATVSGLVGGEQITLNPNVSGLGNQTTGNGTVSFSSALAAGTAYNVQVTSEPVGKTCLVSSGSGSLSVNTNVMVSCAPKTYSLKASATGLAAGDNLVLSSGAGLGNQTVTSTNSPVTFGTANHGTAYNVQIVTQPTGKTCTATGATSGTLTADTTVNFNCVPKTYSLKASATGLAAGDSLVLSSGAAGLGNQTVTSTNSPVTFGSANHGTAYSVQIVTQPTGKTCTVSGSASGTLTADTTVNFSCSTNSYSLKASATGLAAGDSLVLSSGAAGLGNQTVTSTNSPVTFGSANHGTAYNVQIVTQPTGKTCTVSGSASGTLTADTTVNFSCALKTYTLKASATGLAAGDSLVLSSGAAGLGNQTVTSSNSPVTFGTANHGTAYNVQIVTQPTGKTCTATGATSGTLTADTTVAFNCTVNTYAITAHVSGLTGSETLRVSEALDGSDFTASTSGFQSIANRQHGSSYSVTLGASPTGKTCSVTSGALSGTITAGVALDISCVVKTYTITAEVQGLAAGESLLVTQGAETLTLSGVTGSATAKQAFLMVVAHGSSYAVNLGTAPTGKTCTTGANASSPAGGITANVDVVISCAASTYPVTVQVTGLSGSEQLTVKLGSETLTLSASAASQVFATPITHGAGYAATLGANPAVGTQCSVSSGNLQGSNVTAPVTIAVSCVQTFVIGGQLSDLPAGWQLVLQNNGGDDLTVSADGPFAFATRLASGQPYDVRILSVNAKQAQAKAGTQAKAAPSCSVVNGTGTVTGTAPSGIGVVCTAAAVATVQPVPTLGSWAMALLALMAAGMGWRGLQRRAH